METSPATSISMIQSLDHFLDTLRQSELLRPEQWTEVADTLQGQFEDAESLARELERRGWLTPFQTEQLVQGHRLLPLRLGSYVLLDRLGKGGMGEVFRARHRLMDRVVALKVIRQEALGEPAVARRFQREMQAIARLDHPNVVQALDAEEFGGWHFLIMEYIEGHPLHQVVRERGPLPLALACDYTRQAALGLQHAHDRGVVHRDVKPANLLLTMAGVVKVMDLGLAMLLSSSGVDEGNPLTASNVILGTPDFMAPEQALKPKTAGTRSDIYSLGCTLYFLLAGRPPFPKGEALEKVLLHQNTPPMGVEYLRRDVPQGLAQVLRRMMAKKPEDRHPNFRQVVADLVPFCQGPSGEGVPLVPNPETPELSALTPALPPSLTPWSGEPPRTEFPSATLPSQVPPPWPGPRRGRPRLRWSLLGGLGLLLLLAAGLTLWLFKGQGGAETEIPQGPEKEADLLHLRVAPAGGDFTSIAAAVQKARPGARITVAAGTYTEPVVLDRNVEIMAEGTDRVLLRTTDTSCLDMRTDRARVRGLTLECLSRKTAAVWLSQGSLILEDCDIRCDFSPGITVRNPGTAPLVRGCKVHGTNKNPGIRVELGAQGKFEKCEIIENDVGLEIRGQADPLFLNCTFTRNLAAAVLVHEKGKGTLEGCAFSLTNLGAAIQVSDADTSPSFLDCRIFNNNRAGLHVSKQAHCQARGCIITDNGMGGVVLSDRGCQLLLEKCQINGNRLTQGVMAFGGKLILLSNDLTNNAAGAVLVGPGVELEKKDNQGFP